MSIGEIGEFWTKKIDRRSLLIIGLFFTTTTRLSPYGPLLVVELLVVAFFGLVVVTNKPDNYQLNVGVSLLSTVARIKAFCRSMFFSRLSVSSCNPHSC